MVRKMAAKAAAPADPEKGSEQPPPFNTHQKKTVAAPKPRGRPAKTLPPTPSLPEVQQEAINQTLAGVGEALMAATGALRELKQGQDEIKALAQRPA